MQATGAASVQPSSAICQGHTKTGGAVLQLLAEGELVPGISADEFSLRRQKLGPAAPDRQRGRRAVSRHPVHLTWRSDTALLQAGQSSLFEPLGTAYLVVPKSGLLLVEPARPPYIPLQSQN